MNLELLGLLNELLKQPIISSKQLEEEMGLSKRQIVYRLNKINEYLAEKNAGPLAFNGNKELVIDDFNRQIIMSIVKEYHLQQQYYLSKEERLTYIYLMLFIHLDYLSLQYFMHSLQISRSSVLLDLKELENSLHQKQINIENNRTRGYYLVGDEMTIRKQMMQLVSNALSHASGANVFHLFIDEYGLEGYELVKERISELAEKWQISFVEDRLEEFIFIFVLLKERMLYCEEKELEVLQSMNLETMEDTKELKFTHDLLAGCQGIKEVDKKYISAWVLGLSIGNAKEVTKDLKIISGIVNKILTRFESLSGFYYRNYDQIFQQLYAHFRPAYYRLLFHLPINNPLCERVKKEYRELYLLVSETMKPFGGLFSQMIPEEEIAYLTMHFATIFAKKEDCVQLPKRTALIVCSNGIGSSAILYSELKSLFPELNILLPVDSANIKNVREKIDLIFTTTSMNLEEQNIPIIKVSPVMSSRERYRVVREVYSLIGNLFFMPPQVDEVMKIVKKYAEVGSESALQSELMSYFFKVEGFPQVSPNKRIDSLLDVMKKSYIRLNVVAENWEDALIQSAYPLVESGAIEVSYVEEIIKSVKANGAYFVITKHVALPHVRYIEVVNECAIGITCLQEPIEFGSKDNDPVKYIFTLAAKDNESHIHAIAELVELLEDAAFFKLLDDAKDADEVIAFIRQHQK